MVPLKLFICLLIRFRARFTRLAGPRCTARFFEHFRRYVEAMGREAERRDRDHVLDLESFIRERRDSSAISLSFSLIEYALDIDLPDQVFEDQNFTTAYLASVDMIFLANVSCSR